MHRRASRIAGFHYHPDSGSEAATKGGGTPERLLAVSAWRHSPRFPEAGRAALAPAGAVTRPSAAPDPVPDAVWADAPRHHAEARLGHRLLAIAVSNLYNRRNVPACRRAGPPGGRLGPLG